jgi:hypothetical protein
VSIFNNLNLPDSLGDEFKSRFSDELVRNVFREAKRTELCLNEADIISLSRSERGMSMEESNLNNNGAAA